MDSDKNTTKAESERRSHRAGALDIRNVIGSLLGVYAVILVLMGIFGDKELEKTGDVNANLWAGLALAVVSACFLAWARARPLVVPHTTG